MSFQSTSLAVVAVCLTVGCSTPKINGKVYPPRARTKGGNEIPYSTFDSDALRRYTQARAANAAVKDPVTAAALGDSLTTAVNTFLADADRGRPNAVQPDDAMTRALMSPSSGSPAENSAKSAALAKVNNSTTKQAEFEGIGFSIGPGLKFGGKKEVRDASVDGGGNVRVDSERSAQPLLLLSIHHMFTPFREFMGVEAGRWGFGPWVGVTFSGDGSTIDNFALGAMISFRFDEELEGRSASAFGIGIGALYDDSVTVLADGVESGAPPPDGVTNLTKTTSDWAAVILVNFAFHF